MKAIVYTKYGPPEVLSIKETPRPHPKVNEVLIEVHVATMNRTDTGLRSAEYFISRLFTGLFKPKCVVGGTEFAGKIVEKGKNVTEFKVGDKVFGFNDVCAGGHAQFKIETSDGPITKIPAGLSYRDAAPAGEGATYALNNIMAARVEKNHKVMVYGATGSIGSAALQIIKNHYSASVTAVCGTKNIELVKSLGADKVIDYQKEDFTKDTEKYDFVFDTVGKVTYSSIKHLLKPSGKFCSTGVRIFFTAIWHRITGKSQAIFSIPKVNKENIELIAQMLKSGEFKPIIDKIYSMEQASKAASYAETGKKVGNLLITVK